MKPSLHQVAGHKGTLTDEEGSLFFKPTNKQELAFYSTLLSHDSTKSDKLSDWIPLFFGELKENDKEYIVLQNLYHTYSQPLILDIKLGSILYDENATPDKVERMKKTSSSTTSGSLNFRICGMKLFASDCLNIPQRFEEYATKINVDISGETSTADFTLLSDSTTSSANNIALSSEPAALNSTAKFSEPAALNSTAKSSTSAAIATTSSESGINDTTGHATQNNSTYYQFNKFFGRSLTSSNAIDGIELFFKSLPDLKVFNVLNNFHKRLQLLYNCLLDYEIRIISGSLLLIIENDPKKWVNWEIDDFQNVDPLIKFPESDDDDIFFPPSLSQLNLIDFAHSKFVIGKGHDENILQGIENLLNSFEKLLKKYAKITEKENELDI